MHAKFHTKDFSYAERAHDLGPLRCTSRHRAPRVDRRQRPLGVRGPLFDPTPPAPLLALQVLAWWAFFRALGRGGLVPPAPVPFQALAPNMSRGMPVLKVAKQQSAYTLLCPRCNFFGSVPVLSPDNRQVGNREGDARRAET